MTPSGDRPVALTIGMVTRVKLRKHGTWKRIKAKRLGTPVVRYNIQTEDLDFPREDRRLDDAATERPISLANFQILPPKRTDVFGSTAICHINNKTSQLYWQTDAYVILHRKEKYDIRASRITAQPIDSRWGACFWCDCPVENVRGRLFGSKYPGCDCPRGGHE